MISVTETQKRTSFTTFTGQFMRVRINDELYGIDLFQTQGVVGSREFSPIANSPEYVRGSVTLAGEKLPVIDMRARFGLQTETSDFHTHIILVHTEVNGKQLKAGLLVDEVLGVDVTIPSAVTDVPSYGETGDTEYLFGILNQSDGVVKLIDLVKVLSMAR